MSNTHPANQTRYRIRIEDIAHHAISFALIKSTLGTTCDNTTCILASVLEERKTLADLGRSVYRRIMEQ